MLTGTQQPRPIPRFARSHDEQHTPLAWAHDLGLVEGYNDPDRGKLLCPGENVERQRAATVLARAFTMGVLK